MADLRVIGAQELDYASFVRLQQEAYAEIIAKTGAGYLFTESYYRWKYNPPSGQATIALVLDQGAPIAANSMFPLRLRAGETTLQGWQSCDTATHPTARGKGYFMKCLGALKERLPADSVFFGFPNKNSTPGFLKFGWRHHSDIHTRFRILPGRRSSGFSRIDKLSSFGDAESAFASTLAQRTGTHIDRDPSYLNWRYFKHPLHQYEAFVWVEDSKPAGLIVLRVVTLNDRQYTVALELLALSNRVQRGLLRFAAAWAREKRVGKVIVLNNTTGTWSGLACGYLPVPMWALPKRQILMGAATGSTAERLWDAPWAVQIGDWDGF